MSLSLGDLVSHRSVFDLSHDRKLSFNFGKLYPVFCEDVIPGDTWTCSSDIFVRCMPLLTPVMHQVNIHVEFFFVPNRLVWRFHSSVQNTQMYNWALTQSSSVNAWEMFITGYATDAKPYSISDPQVYEQAIPRPPQLYTFRTDSGYCTGQTGSGSRCSPNTSVLSCHYHSLMLRIHISFTYH